MVKSYQTKGRNPIVKIYILGIGGTFMAGVAILAKSLGHDVTGVDERIYSPMKEQLESHDIAYDEGYVVQHLTHSAGSDNDLVLIGNALSRGNQMVEYVLNNNVPFCSAPQWLYDHVLKDKWVLAVAGTHGKTTTASMLAWILSTCEYQPGFLIGGIAENFGVSAALGDSDFFVIEADEYDSAFFDKRSKFMHYHPKTLLINNLEFDHADIFADLNAIQTQFSYLLRTVPQIGQIIYPIKREIQDVIAQGCWSEQVVLGKDWQVKASVTGESFVVSNSQEKDTAINWQLCGQFNVENALGAVVAAYHVGVKPEFSAQALASFQAPKRRLELIKTFDSGCRVYDDFAHHPTAIAKTIEAMKQVNPSRQLIVIVEIASNTMRLDIHVDALKQALKEADIVLIYEGERAIEWEVKCLGSEDQVFMHTTDIDMIYAELLPQTKQCEVDIVIMSNRNCGGLRNRL